MDFSSPFPRKVKVLSQTVARKIAAGEVIDRPLSVLRELLDNALDAGSQRIEVRWEAGGLKSIQVVDDGWGMGEEDLELCWLPHATSKIESEEDLNSLSSLGFRGEALASIAACSRLSITTSSVDSGLAYQLVVENSQIPKIRKTSGKKGTRVLVEDLFYNIPARKNFMKSPASESALCRKAFDDKALSFPQVGFELWVDDKLKAQYPPESSLARLVRVAGGDWNLGEVLSFTQENLDFSLQVFALQPPFSRSDRKNIQIFANRRPIQDFSFVQAVCHAFEGFLPGGAFPQAFVFLQVAPHLVDFNIHPAKKEARFRNLPAIHHALSSGLKEKLSQNKLKLPTAGPLDTAPELPLEVRETGYYPTPTPTPTWPAPGRESSSFPYHQLKEVSQTEKDGKNAAPVSFRYLGQVMGVFLLVEKDETLFLIDQHAAHERILYERLQARRNQTQPLLVPLIFQTEAGVSELLQRDQGQFERLGIGYRSVSALTYELVHVPQAATHLEKEILLFLRDYSRPVQDLEKALYASLACRSAVMDGDMLDPSTAQELVKQAFSLEDARCPHGRPIWFAINRRDLFLKVGRIV